MTQVLLIRAIRAFSVTRDITGKMWFGAGWICILAITVKNA